MGVFPIRARALRCVAAATLLAATVAADERTVGILAPDTPFETDWSAYSADAPGPTVVITGGMHGDEPAGARAAGQIATWTVTRGRLVVLPRCNEPALAARRRRIPGLKDEAGDLNRHFPPTAREHHSDQAARIWEFVLRWEPDVLVDLHEGYGFRAAGSKSVGSSVITQRAADHPRRARLLAAVNADIDEPQRRFVALGPTVAGSLVGAVAQLRDIEAHLFETTHTSQPLSTRCRQHRCLAAALLEELGMADDSAGRLVDPTASTPTLALFDGGGTGGGPALFEGLLPSWRVERVGPADIGNGALGSFDTLLFPGGSGSGQARALGARGRERVRAFVSSGGGYVGVCAGAYLALDNYTWGLHLIALDSHDREHWRRGNGTVRVEVCRAGEELLAAEAGEEHDIHFAQGPLMVPAAGGEPEGGPQRSMPEVLARFTTGIGENGADPAMMVGKPAAVRSLYGAGRVLLFSPHPEKTAGLEAVIERGLAWAAARD
ncbi:MAG: hypothetical protein CMJ84_11310 [Planctomycetes bacterium]|jgi:hypothetical protein|nr:hypothetical protein [Planctomycetota bacterium]MDP6409263.1 BPL-N domain-containing protein [Planctomycetota bacterium]